MASPAASDFGLDAAPEPDAHAAPEPDVHAASAVLEDIQEIDHEILIQRAILASLQDTVHTPDIVERTRRAEAEIKRLKKRLADARKQGAASKDSPANMNYNTPFDRHPYPRQPSGYSSPFSMSTPGSASSMWSAGEQPRPSSRLKRSYTSHLDGENNNAPGNKSQKTSPSPALHAPFPPPRTESPVFDLTGFTDGEVIDLTSIDDEFVKQQDVQMQSYKKAMERRERDAEVARRFQLSGSFGDSSPGPSAYDRMLGRSSLPRSSTGPPGLPSLPDRRPKPEQIEPSPLSSSTTSYRMPGSYYDEGNGYLPGTPPSRLPYQASPMDRSGYMPPRATLPSRPSPSNAHGHSRAALAQSNPPGALPFAQFSNNNPFANLPSDPALFTTPSHPSIWSQPPGMGSTGFAGTGILPTMAFHPQPPVLPIRSDALGDIIRRTAGMDYQFPWPSSDMADTEEDIKALIRNIRPDEEIPAKLRGSTPDALRYPLYPHQQLALEWMKKMEEGTNKGGILADDMGLGKTISTLALMASRPSENRTCRTNLIIGPVALIKQWEAEIKQKLKGGPHAMSVFLLHGKKTTYDELRVYDVVLTTYGTVSQEWKRYHRWIAEHPEVDHFNDATLAKKHPLVHPKNVWYRVILDEAQCIKNKETQSSKGAHQIVATYRWCLTGTPMMNSISELYSLFRFLRIKPYHDYTKFNQSFYFLTAKNTVRAPDEERQKQMQRLRAVLKATMLRRMKDSLIDGKPILNLPPKSEVITHVVFSEEEQNFYKQLESNAQVQFNKYLRAGTVGKNYSNILVLLLRLRQACCHPHLNLDFDTVATTSPAETMMAMAKEILPAVVARVKEIEAFECPICYDAAVNPYLVLPCGHDSCSECFQRLIGTSLEDGLRGGNENAGAAKCPQCRGPVDPKRAIDYHTFVRVHMPEKAAEMGLVPDEKEEDQIDDEETSSDERSTDSEDGEDVDKFGNLMGFVVPDDGGDDMSDPAKVERKSKPKKDKKTRKAQKAKKGANAVEPHMLKKLRQEAHKNADSRRRYMHYLRDNWEPSAKVTKACEILEGIQATGEKTIVFSVWTGLLDLLEIQIKYHMGLKYSRYDGGMSPSQRDISARSFQEDPRVSIMLVSLKAGNAGLNLTAASQVIIMDPFWNPYIEMQAVDRAHRIGQQRPVHVHRILVEGTVEDRIVDLQEQKRALVEAALDEGANQSIGRLDNRQLRYLFGVNN